MTEASVSFAGNLTDDPELRHTEGRHRPSGVPGGGVGS
jgi:single-stranded DNA-binding protein